MAVIRNSIVCLQAAQLPIFRETIEQVVAKYHELKAQFDANASTSSPCRRRTCCQPLSRARGSVVRTRQ